MVDMLGDLLWLDFLLANDVGEALSYGSCVWRPWWHQVSGSEKRVERLVLPLGSRTTNMLVALTTSSTTR